MNKLSTFLNYFFSLASFLLLIFAWGMYISSSVFISILFCALFFVIFSLVYFLIKGKTEKKYVLKKADKELKEKCMTAIKLLDNNQRLDFFCRMFCLPASAIDFERHCLIFEDKEMFFSINEKELSERVFVNICHTMKSKKVEIVSFGVSKEVSYLSKFLTDTQFVFTPCPDLFPTMKERNIFPKTADLATPSKGKFLEAVTSLIVRQKSKGYALIGIFLLLFSFISPFKLYYQIFATVLILFSVVVFFLKRKTA